MSSIIIKENIERNARLNNEISFAVMIPGFLATGKSAESANKFFNGICEFNDQASFESTVGLVAPVEGHYGNQMAYELLGLGYRVFYKSMGDVQTEKEASTNKEAIAKLKLTEDEEGYFWNNATDKAAYDFRYILNGLLEDNKEANEVISKIANDRGDCLAIIDIDESATGPYSSANATHKAVIEAISAAGVEYNTTVNTNTQIMTPSVTYGVTYSPNAKFSSNKKFPASFHYLACAKQSLNKFAEWYAVAGYNRGYNYKFVIDTPSYIFGDLDVEALGGRTQKTVTTISAAAMTKEVTEKTTVTHSRAINLIVHAANGFYIWGNRTAALLPADTHEDLNAGHFLNIRQLNITLKKRLFQACRELTFDPNSDVLWLNFTSKIVPLLEKMQADQGIRNYMISKKESTERGKFLAVIRIVPIEAVEDFEITLSVENSLGDTTTDLTEILKTEN